MPVLFKNAKAFETWLGKHCANSSGLWLMLVQRGAHEPTVTETEAVETALCWGLIDGQKKRLDDQHFLQRFSPRRARSVWSKVKVENVAALIDTGRLKETGFAQIEAAKADGPWVQVDDGARTSAVPGDLLLALEAEPKAKAFLATVNAATRYAVPWRMQTAVKPETRAKRMAQLVAMLPRGEVIHASQPKAKALARSSFRLPLPGSEVPHTFGQTLSPTKGHYLATHIGVVMTTTPTLAAAARAPEVRWLRAW